MAKNVNGLCVLCDAQVVGGETVCVIKNNCNRSDVWAETEERVVHRACSTT